MRCKILLVEPDPTISKHLAFLIRQRGYECHAVASVPSALAELRRRPYEVIIVDLDLTGGRPQACATEFRDAGAAARLIGLDSRGEPPGDDPVHHAFDAVIPKPFVVEPLFAALPTPS